ncbi:3-oxoacyl-ACP reductase [Phreatobacter cathodiphilus]|uniref:3-oxoacyl-ACP reductase n=2 Tax=Phreatobacter cathodiphilus TaxID=1868589 RepID=A0A2S0N6L2_9HYPH|nr:SDR family oxidoreductase [Phreatobacter cathodiphilus]AVO43756.1 3-oxoacyl-ACP reductase [Phreatobacter cathodiphilus]
MTMSRLADRVALVFGAGSVGPGWGNGKASAVAYARAGARVVCVDINRSAAEETVGIIRGEGGTAEALACDVTKLLEVEDVVARTGALFGPVDILHNNVGHAKMGGPPDLSEDEWRREMDLNVTGMFLACKVVIPTMQARGRGVITNISSSAGIRYVGYPYTSYYAAKGAVNQFTVGVALQYARDGIRCNAILPGLMDTPLIYQQISVQYASPDDMVKARHEATPMGRMGTGWDVANAAVFLASDEASYINAVCLPVDGGFTARCA